MEEAFTSGNHYLIFELWLFSIKFDRGIAVLKILGNYRCLEYPARKGTRNIQQGKNYCVSSSLLRQMALHLFHQPWKSGLLNELNWMWKHKWFKYVFALFLLGHYLSNINIFYDLLVDSDQYKMFQTYYQFISRKNAEILLKYNKLVEDVSVCIQYVT